MKTSRIHRLLKLITLLQSGKAWVGDTLAREVQVSRRTLFRDLRMLKHAGIPLEFDPGSRSHRIEKNFFLPPVNLTLTEALALMALVHKRAGRMHLPNHDDAISGMLKVQSSLPRELQDYCDQAIEAIEVRPAPATDASRSAELFEKLWEAASRSEAVDIVYESFYERTEIQTRLRPYRLVCMPRGWYVIGHSVLHKEVRTFKVDRILSVEPTGQSFRVPRDFSLKSHFGNAWQMIRGAQRYDVQVRFSPKVAGNVEEVLWHPTQQTQRLDDGGLMFEAKVDGIEEIAWWILGYGEQAVVQQPAELRRLIRQHVCGMAAVYGVSLA